MSPNPFRTTHQSQTVISNHSLPSIAHPCNYSAKVHSSFPLCLALDNLLYLGILKVGLIKLSHNNGVVCHPLSTEILVASLSCCLIANKKGSSLPIASPTACGCKMEQILCGHNELHFSCWRAVTKLCSPLLLHTFPAFTGSHCTCKM